MRWFGWKLALRIRSYKYSGSCAQSHKTNNVFDASGPLSAHRLQRSRTIRCRCAPRLEPLQLRHLALQSQMAFVVPIFHRTVPERHLAHSGDEQERYSASFDDFRDGEDAFSANICVKQCEVERCGFRQPLSLMNVARLRQAPPPSQRSSYE